MLFTGNWLKTEASDSLTQNIVGKLSNSLLNSLIAGAPFKMDTYK